MGATGSLRREHQILRARLRLLEAAMQMAPEAQFALREMCWSLARMLDEHIRHEVEALQPYHNRIQALIQARMAQDHADQQVVLRGVNALLLGGINAPVSRAVPPLAELIKELRHHMAQEEQEVFPMVDQLAEEQAAPSYGIGSVITETMTVNHVLHVHPQTREVFRAMLATLVARRPVEPSPADRRRSAHGPTS